MFSLTRWFLTHLESASVKGLDVTFTRLFNTPEGVKISTSLSEVVWQIPGLILSRIFNEILAFNFLILFGFVSSFVTFYFLTLYLTKSKHASFVSAVAYTFSPYHYWQSLSHLSLSLIQWLPLFVLSLFYFDQKKNLASTIFLIGSYGLVLYSSFYYGFFVGLITILFFVTKFILNLRDYLRLRILSLLILFVIGAFLVIYPLLENLSRVTESNSGVKEAFGRKLDELVALSARPWDYLIFPPNHPVFGRFNRKIYDFIGSKGSDFKVRSAYLPERVVFLGFTNLVLALTGLIYYLKQRNRTVLIISVLLIGSFIISLPPYFSIKGITFYTPSFLFYKFLPLVRVYVRFGILVSLFTFLLSAFGFKALLQKTRVVKVYFLVVLVTGLVLFEFWPQAGAYTDLRRIPPVYEWLGQQTGDLVILEYPKAYDLQTALLYQRLHGKKIWNMPSSEPRYKGWEEVEDLTNPAAAARLKVDGVSYVIFHLIDPAPNPYDDWRFFRAAKYPDSKENELFTAAGLSLVREFPEALVYKVN